MCGIAGIKSFNKEPVEKETLIAMQSFMEERGPDCREVWNEGNIGFAHTRLKILDLSDAGKQPMLSANRRFVITYNGEIYNYQELRRELEKAGYSFISQSDTEVLLNACEKWGINQAMEKLEGMFAFALYDKINQTLFLCRDRFGQKPLYFFEGKNLMAFSSDIKVLHNQYKSSLSINYKALDYYLTELSVPQPKTIWNEINQVQPGHYLKIDANGKIEENQYYSLNFPSTSITGFDDAKEIIIEKLNQAIHKRTVSDVAIGTFLSGGIDSGLITAILAKDSNKPINTFTISLPGFSENEEMDALEVAKRYNTNHTSVPITKPQVEEIDQIVEYCGEHVADSSCIPTFLISKAISKHVKVAISGDGGDECFAGYHDYGWAQQTDTFMKAYPNDINRRPKVLASKIKKRLMNTSGSNLGHLQHYYKSKPWEKLYRKMGFHPGEKEQLYQKDFLKQYGTGYARNHLTEVWDKHKQQSIFSTLHLASFQTRLLNDYLVKIDRMGMMNSLEIRSPFLDHQLIECALSISPELLTKKGQPKYFLKTLAKDYLGEKIISRKKRGFGIPIDSWLRNELKQVVMDDFTNAEMCNIGMFNHEYIQLLISKHMAGSNEHTHKIWALWCLEKWFKNFAK